MRNKIELTKKLIELFPDEQKISVESAIPLWWHNLRDSGGMRLTSTGYNTFVQDLKMEHYEYTIEDPLIFNKKIILGLDRKLQTPYYIHAVKGVPKTLVLFGSREAVMIKLYGNLSQFLDNYRP